MNPLKVLPVLLIVLALGSCTKVDDKNPSGKISESSMNMQSGGSDETGSVKRAIAILYPASGSKVKGIVSFTATNDGKVKVVADIEGLTPGKHGFHVHEFGDCSAPDANSAGPHFSVTNNPHGAPTDKKRHTGDLGNITAGSDGKAHYELPDLQMPLSGKSSIIGRAVIVHGGEDDLKSQPAGNSGPRVACGVIGIVK